MIPTANKTRKEVKSMVLQVFVLLVGFLLLVKGADWFVEGAAGIARKLGISQLAAWTGKGRYGYLRPLCAYSSCLDGLP